VVAGDQPLTPTHQGQVPEDHPRQPLQHRTSLAPAAPAEETAAPTEGTGVPLDATPEPIEATEEVGR
jgi:hypothetical protein